MNYDEVGVLSLSFKYFSQKFFQYFFYNQILKTETISKCGSGGIRRS